MPISILHLEDDSNDALLVRRYLRKGKPDWTVAWVATREHFLGALATTRFDVILCDYRLPDWDGDQALDHVLRAHPQLPVIMLTGEASEDRIVETVARGASNYVLKDGLGRLIPAIERAVRGESRVNRQSRDLADLRRLHELSARLLEDGDFGSMLQRVLDACIELMGADKGLFQIYDEGADALVIKGHVGFGPEFLEHFHYVSVGQDCVCARAFARKAQVLAENVFEEPYPELHPVFRREGLTAVISTPVLGGDGRILGMLSTHFARSHRPSSRELDLLDLYIRQAARVIEYKLATL
jgi:CheY-like chemotaxis protein